MGSMVCFSNSQRLLRQARTPHRSINPVTASYGYLLNPQPVISGQDALGLITIYPRPDEHEISAAAPGQRRPQPSLFSPPFHRRNHRSPSRRAAVSTTIFLHPHVTIEEPGCQHIQKNNRITVYPFTHSVTGKPLSKEKGRVQIELFLAPGPSSLYLITFFYVFSEPL